MQTFICFSYFYLRTVGRFIVAIVVVANNKDVVAVASRRCEIIIARTNHDVRSNGVNVGEQQFGAKVGLFVDFGVLHTFDPVHRTWGVVVIVVRDGRGCLGKPQTHIL